MDLELARVLRQSQIVEPEAPMPLDVGSIGRIGPNVQRELLAQRDEAIVVALDLLAVEIALRVGGIGPVEVVAAREYRVEPCTSPTSVMPWEAANCGI